MDQALYNKPMSLNRRQVLGLGLSSMGLSQSALTAQTVFPQGVASGDPADRGAVFWTRVAPEAFVPAEPLYLELSQERSFAEFFALTLADWGPLTDYTAKAVLEGVLQPDSRYYYRFVYRGVYSPIGRCKTLAEAGVTPPKVRLGLVTCQEFTNGYYGGYAHLAREDLDAVLHLGDLIYEYSADPRWRQPRFADRTFGLPSGSYLAVNLADFRALYRHYRDPFMQQAMAAHPFVVIWDDHETANDTYWDYTLNAPGAPDHPFRQDPERLRNLKKAAAQAWSEWIPAKVTINPQSVQRYADIARVLRFGDLASLFLTDTRSFRSPHPCGEGGTGQRSLAICPAKDDPQRTMLGLEQRDWLLAGLLQDSARWSMLASAVMFSPFVSGAITINLDGWDGYAAERSLLLDSLAKAGRNNLAVLSGDLHAALAATLRSGERVLGAEFMTPGLTSPGPAETVRRMGLPWPGNGFIEALNSHLRFFEGELNGYAIIELTPEFIQYELYSIDKTRNSAATGKRLARKLRFDGQAMRDV